MALGVFLNAFFRVDNQKRGFYHVYTALQEKTLVDTLFWLKDQSPEVFSFNYVLGHDEVSPNRKSDPGAALSRTMPEFREYFGECKFNDCAHG